MWAVMVEVCTPCRHQCAGMAQAVEQMFIQAFVGHRPVDGEDGPAPEMGPYTGPTLQKEHFHEPSHRGP